MCGRAGLRLLAVSALSAACLKPQRCLPLTLLSLPHPLLLQAQIQQQLKHRLLLLHSLLQLMFHLLLLPLQL